MTGGDDNKWSKAFVNIRRVWQTRVEAVLGAAQVFLHEADVFMLARFSS